MKTRIPGKSFIGDLTFMDIFSLSSTAHYSTHTPPPFSATILAVRPHHHHPSSVFSTQQPSEPPENSPSTSLRRPASHKPPKTPKTSNDPKLHTNPLKSLLTTQHNPSPTRPTAPSLTSKLRLSSKLAPPPPAPPPPHIPVEMPPEEAIEATQGPEDEFVEKGKIFVGNLPLWIKKNEVAKFFRQFGLIKNVILIKGFDDNERNMGFGFVIYGGPTADKAAMMAVEFDGVEFHCRVLTVKLDDGRRLKEKTRERVRWVDSKDDGRRLHKSS